MSQPRVTCIIGGLGFIGAAVTQRLLESGGNVVIIDRGTPKSPLDPRVRFIQGEYSNPTILATLAEVDDVLLLAYASVPKTSFADPLTDLTDNLPSVLELFKAATNHQLRKIVVVSSGGTVYGVAETLPITEDHPTHPVSPYGITKLAVEKYAQMYHRLSGLPIVIIRPANAYGPGQQPFTGQGFIATAFATILEEKEVTLFGVTGTVRDYIYIDDLADAVIAVLDRGQIGQIYNVGSGQGVNNQQILEQLEPLATSQNRPLRVRVQPERPFDVPTNVLDSQRLTKDTRWQPKTSLAEGLRKTWQHFLDRYQPLTSQKPAVTVLLPVYNAGPYLKAAIQSILDQTFTDFELLIINDASTDQSATVMTSFNDPRIRLVTNKTNRNLIGTLNKGLKLAKGELIARMDQDDISLPTRLTTQVNFLRTHPSAVLVGSEAEFIDTAGQVIGYDRAFLDDQTIRQALTTTNAFVHGSVMFRKKTALSLHGYNPVAYLAEDYDMWVRLATVGQVANIGQILYRWRVNPSGMSLSNARKQRQAAQKIAKKAWRLFSRQTTTRQQLEPLIDDQQKRQHKLAELDIQLARGHLARQQRAQAITHVMAALKQDPTFWLFYFYLLMAIVPEKWFFNLESVGLDRYRTKRGF